MEARTNGVNGEAARPGGGDGRGALAVGVVEGSRVPAMVGVADAVAVLLVPTRCPVFILCSGRVWEDPFDVLTKCQTAYSPSHDRDDITVASQNLSILWGGRRRTYADIRNRVGVISYGRKTVLEVNSHVVKVGEVGEGDGGDEKEGKGEKEKDESRNLECARLEVDGHVVLFLYEVLRRTGAQHTAGGKGTKG